MRTISQRIAEVAFNKVKEKQAEDRGAFEEYETFAKKFPSLIHACGLAQAIAFAEAKKETEYLDHLAAVIQAAGQPVDLHQDLARKSREEPLGQYLRLSRLAITAAGWLKRYVEAFKKD